MNVQPRISHTYTFDDADVDGLDRARFPSDRMRRWFMCAHKQSRLFVLSCADNVFCRLDSSRVHYPMVVHDTPDPSVLTVPNGGDETCTVQRMAVATLPGV